MEKANKYALVLKQIDAIIEDEKNTVSKMSTIAGVLKQEFPNFYWVGFYIYDEGILKIGPYQGTVACTKIKLTDGICGRAFTTKKIQIVEDVHQEPNHIACDPKSNAEIVLPIINKQGNVTAVLDVDSEVFNNFDKIDAKYLQLIIEKHLKN